VRGPLRETDTVLLVGPDVLKHRRVSSARTQREKKKSLLFAHSDDLENGEEDGRCGHRGRELQHGRNIGGDLGRGDHPIERVVARTASDCPESHGKTRIEYVPKKRSCPGSPECSKNLARMVTFYRDTVARRPSDFRRSSDVSPNKIPGLSRLDFRG